MPDPGGEFFAARMLAWFDRHGRHDLPWQRLPYASSGIEPKQSQVGFVNPQGLYQLFVVGIVDRHRLAKGRTIGSQVDQHTGLGHETRHPLRVVDLCRRNRCVL